MTDEELTVTIQAAGPEHARVALAGRFDFVAAVAVRERLARPELAAARHLVIDLTDVTFLDSAGLAALARDRRDRMLRGAALTLIRPASEPAMRVLRLTQFDEIFTMVDHSRVM